MDLLKAVEHESVEKIEQMLKHEIPHNLEEWDYEILVKAFERGEIRVIKLTLQKNCRVNKIAFEENLSSTPLHYAVKLENSELVSELLKKGASINAIDENGNSPLHLAFIRRNEKILKLFIISIEETNNYNNKTNNDGLSHLHIVCSRQESSTIIKAYHEACPEDISKKVNTDAPKWKGFTTLHFAVKFHSMSSIKTLLELNEKLIDAINFHEKTALEIAEKYLKEYNEIFYYLKTNTSLHFAFYHNALEDKSSIIELLFEKAKREKNCLDSQDKNGLSYLHIAVSLGDLEFVETFLNQRNEDVNSEVCLNSKAFSNYAPIHFAVKYGKDDMVKLLIERGVDVNKISSDGTALHIACEFGHCEIIDLLLKSDADVNIIRQGDGKTPLQTLVRFFSENCQSNGKHLLLQYIEQLIRLSTDVNVVDKSNRTALCQHPNGLFIDGFAQCIKLLLKNGADINLGGSFTIEDNLDAQKFHMENCQIFFDHVFNLHELGYAVSQENYDNCKKILKGKNLNENSWLQSNKLEDKQNHRLAEVQKMRDLKLTGAPTLYDFLHLEPRRANLYIKNKKLVQIIKNLENVIEDQKYDEENQECIQFPMYASLIRLHYKKAANYTEPRVKCTHCKNVSV